MKKKNTEELPHPQGEDKLNTPSEQLQAIALDTEGGRFHVQWDQSTPLTPMGQLVFFAQFLEASGLLRKFYEDAPLEYTSRNSPDVRDVLGTAILSILAGHHRYAHINGLRFDAVNPALLGMSKVMSEDCVRRAMKKMDSKDAAQWLSKQMLACWEPLLCNDWILDIDTTVKTVYGYNNSTGYNPHKPGRPSQVYHTFFMGTIRLCLGVDVQPASKHAAKYTMPKLWELLGQLERSSWPTLLRADCAYGNENVLGQAEQHDLKYLCRLRKTPKVKELIQMLELKGRWERIPGDNREGINGQIQLTGWSCSRRVVILRRRKSTSSTARQNPSELLQLQGDDFLVSEPDYEYVVLVTSLDWPLESLAQLYRQRADMENVIDELKNQWGWGGFTTRDLDRCQAMAMLIGLIYNWWSLYTRLIDDSGHHEAITSRPAMLNGVAREVKHSGQKTIKVSLMHAGCEKIRELITQANNFISKVKQAAEQFNQEERWRLMLMRIFRKYLRGLVLIEPPPDLQEAFMLPA